MCTGNCRVTSGIEDDFRAIAFFIVGIEGNYVFFTAASVKHVACAAE